MKFKYRNHKITIADAVVENFTNMIEPTITESLFDMYVEQYFAEDDEEIDDIDLSKFTDEQLSKQFEACMLEECQVRVKMSGKWTKELGNS